MRFSWNDSSQLKASEIQQAISDLSPYLKHLIEVAQKNNYDDAESSINLPGDAKKIQETITLAEKLKSKNLRYIIDIGIGGSNLGAKAAYDAMLGSFDLVEPDRFPKIIFLDTNDPEFLSRVIDLVKTFSSKEEFVVNMVSKSGSTTETVANFEVVVEAIKQKFADFIDRVVLTTDFDSALYRAGQKDGFHLLEIPKSVGGRYSVFSATGLFPLALAGVDINNLCLGAKKMKELCLRENLSDNPAAISATILFLHGKQGKNINDNFFFHPELESLGKWYRQLMGESLGKDGKGLSPTVSIGSTDLHSLGQLYFGGPKDKITTFVYATSPSVVKVPDDKHLSDLAPHIAGKKLTEIMEAIFKGTTTAYLNEKIAYTEVIMDNLSEESIGEYLQFKMMEIMFLARLTGVNAFDQPHVELYKKETKRLLTT